MEPLTVILGFGVFSQEHTCGGTETSPAITVFGVKAPYPAVIMEDPDASRGTFTHRTIPAIGEIPDGLAAEAASPRCQGRIVP